MLKKVLAVAAVLLIGTWVFSRTDVGGYCKVLFKDCVASAKKGIPIEMELKVAEDDLAKLDQVDERLIQTLADEMVLVEKKGKEVARMEENLGTKRADLQTRLDALKSEDTVFVTADGKKMSRGMFQLEAEKAIKQYKVAETMVENARKVLADHQARLTSVKEQRDGLKGKKAALSEQLQALKTKLEALKAAEMQAKRTSGKTEIGELSRLEERLNGIEERLTHRGIVLQLQQEGSEKPATTSPVHNGQDVVRELERIVGGNTGVASEQK